MPQPLPTGHSQNLYPSDEDLKLALKLIQRKGIPKIPKIVAALRDELNNTDYNVDKIIQLISQDPSITGQIIKLINSPAYARSNRIEDIKHASMVLGIQQVANLVTAESLAALSQSETQAVQVVWESINRTAKAAVAISNLLPNFSADEAYLLAMMHDIGSIIFAGLWENYSDTWDKLILAPVSMIEKERKAIGVEHTTLSFLLAKHWKLPDKYALAIYHHHSASCEHIPDEKTRMMVATLKLANYLVISSSGSHVNSQMESYMQSALKELMINDEDWEQIKSDAFWL